LGEKIWKNAGEMIEKPRDVGENVVEFDCGWIILWDKLQTEDLLINSPLHNSFFQGIQWISTVSPPGLA
jgi:hypothetical protein